MSLNTYISIWMFIIGLCLGSFYNVVILRSLSNESIVFPPSKCPKCNHRLFFWHNIPVLSYLLLRGKCYFCHEKISLQYPIIELLTAVLFLGTYWVFGLSFETLFLLIILSSLLIMSVTDLHEKTVDCKIAIFMAIIGLGYNFLCKNILISVIGLFLGIILIELIARAGYLFTKDRAMGEADTYVAAALGACFGFRGLLVILLYSVIVSAFYMLPVFLYKQYQIGAKATPISLIIFLSVSLMYKTLWQNYFLLACIIVFGILTSILVLKGMRNSKTLTYIPFVPVLSLGTLLFLIVSVIH